MPARAFISASGWNYYSWRNSFQEGRPQLEWLANCAARFTAVEVNATFYRLQPVETFRHWRDVHVNFDNDAFGHAPGNALRLIALVRTNSDM